jgi:catechol 2,3-dioxygenase-like lactoylglutathione lyase family enzyme
MRIAFVFLTGLLAGAAVQTALAQQGRIVGLNHVAVSVVDYKAAIDFYRTKMGFREAFSFTEADGSPYLTYFQINRDTFVEVMQATPARPAGCPHFGLEVDRLDSVIEQLRQRGVQVREPSVSTRTGSRIAVATGPGGVNMELLEFGPQSLHRKVIESWKEVIK